jgi:hypothetical protein
MDNSNRSYFINIIQMTITEAQQAVKDRFDLIQMYQAGFLDARKPKNKKELKKFNKDCREAFENRFVVKKILDNADKNIKHKKKPSP